MIDLGTYITEAERREKLMYKNEEREANADKWKEIRRLRKQLCRMNWEEETPDVRAITDKINSIKATLNK